MFDAPAADRQGEDRLDGAAGGPGRSTVLRFSRVAAAGSAGVAVIALAGILGNVLALKALASVRSDYYPMAASTAACLMVFGVALFGYARKPWRGPGLVAVVALILLASLFSLLVVGGSVVGLDLSLQNTLAPGTGSLGEFPLGRMSPATGVAMIIAGAGTGLLLLQSRSLRHARRMGDWASSLGVLTALVGAAVLVSYLYGAPLMYGGTIVPMAEPTALAFLLLGFALIAATGPQSFPMNMMIGDSTSARLSRVFLPLGVGVVFCQALLSRLVEAHDTLLLAVLILVVATVTAYVIARVSRSIARSLDEPNRMLAQMEGRYRGLLEAAPDAMVVVNGAGEIVLLNLQAEKQFGYHRDELVGQQVTNIIPEGFAERIIADDLRSAADALAQQIGTGIELVALRKDRTEFPIELMLSPLEGSEGILVTAAIRDISVRKAAERRLAHLAALVESSDEAIFSKALDGTVLSWNRGAERLYGYTPAEMIGRPISLLLPPDRLHEVEEMIERLLQGEAIEHFETVRVCKNGGLIDISVTVSPIKDADGKITGASTIARDISARKTAEASLLQKVDELARSNEELGQFAYIASHDLQEPLRMVASYTQLLSRRYKGRLDPDADEFIAFAVDGASRMQRLIEDLLAYSRVGTRGLDLVRTSSEEAFGQALLNLRGSIEASGAKVTHAPLPEVLADEHQLVQLFQNLVGNAIKYRRDGVPRVHVSAVGNAKTNWRYAVKDNGIGIDPQYFEKIFGMFQRLHNRDEFAGTGIGLAICKKIVERHGGTISVESRPGRGSTFHFTLTGSGAQP